MKLEQLDRTIFEMLRLELVAGGYLPSYAGLTDADGNLDPALWQAALDSFDQSRLVTLFGAGVPSNRDTKAGHKIVINRMERIKGMLGGNTPYFKSTGTEDAPTWDKKRKAVSSFHIPYEIRTVCATVAMDRELTQMLTDLFGSSLYLKIYNDSPNPSRSFGTEELYFVWSGDVYIKSTEQLECIHNYVFEDAWIENDKTIRTGIVPLKEITVKVKALEDYNDRSVESVDEIIIE